MTSFELVGSSASQSKRRQVPGFNRQSAGFLPEPSQCSSLDRFLMWVDGCRDFPPKGRALIAERGRHRYFPAGWPLLRQGQIARSLYILIEGQVRVERRHSSLREPLMVAELGPGDMVGAMGLLEQVRRPATAIAVTDCEVLELDAPTVAELIVNFPVFGSRMLRLVSQRIDSREDLADHIVRMHQAAVG
jgi:CRP/FNR family cyclic AMP-dependent transcriptional regulator